MKKHLIFILTIFLATSCFFPLLASGRENQITTKRYAIAVGANDGGPNRIKLLYAVSDARSLIDLFQEMGGVLDNDSYILSDPDKKTFFTVLEKVKNQVSTARSEYGRVEFLFYYSGHSDDENILIGNEKIPYRDLRTEIHSINADLHIAVLDSCASGAFARIKGGKKKSPFLMDAAYSMKGYAYMTSSSSNESSQESDHLKASFFTHNLIAGMRGAADSNQDGRVTLNEAYQYAFNETLTQTEKTMSGPQHPNYNIQMIGTGDVVMTDIRKSSVVLTIDKNISGRIFIHDQNNVLVIELNKPQGRPIELGLAEGKYRITTVSEGSIYESRIELRPGEDFFLAADLLQETEKIPATPRGIKSSPQRIYNDQNLVDVPFNFSFISFPPMNSRSVHHASFALISSHCAYLEGIGLSACFQFVDKDASFAQFAGLANITGRNMQYIQMAGTFNITGRLMDGVQAAGAFNYTHERVTGIQMAGAFNYTRLLEGIQTAGGLNIVLGHVSGGQVSGGLNVSASLSGGQVTGGGNIVAGDVTGFQIGGGFNLARNVCGVQLGTLNIGRDIEGAQIGVINIGRIVKGFQLGVINISQRMDHTSLGLINFIAQGKTQFDIWGDELGFLNFGFQHGNGRFYNLYTAGFNSAFNRYLFGWGYGYNWNQQKSFFISSDVMAKSVFPKYDWSWPALWITLRLSLNVSLSKGFSLFGGGSYNYFYTSNEVTLDEPFHGSLLSWSSDRHRHWLGLFAGIKILLSDRTLRKDLP
ncbi:MAG: caspase family protein [Candidatus Aminicenantes bacterium]|nr:caspase family protein [Candidatus Aminicenantes bacterium]